MTKSNYDLEQRAEEILKAFGQELGKSTSAYADAIMEGDPTSKSLKPDFFDDDLDWDLLAAEILKDNPDGSLDFDEKDEGDPLGESAVKPVLGVDPTTESKLDDKKSPEFTTVETKPRGKRNLLRRAIVLIAVLIFAMAMTLFVSEGVRLKVSSLFFKDTLGSTRIMDDSNMVVDLEKVEVGYVPEGFEVVRDETLLDIDRVIDYENNENEKISFCITRTEQYVNNVDDERSTYEKTLINDKQGYLFFDGTYNTVLWQIGDCTFDITSTIDKNLLVEIADSVKVN